MGNDGEVYIYETLRRPSTLLATCRGSYYVSAFEYFADQENKDDILYFLSQCHLIYEQLDVSQTKKIFNGNPWGYQPVKINTHNNVRFLNENNMEEFNSFLSNFNIQIYRRRIGKHENIIDVILENFINKNLIFIDINEFYNPVNVNYYMKTSNPHAILIKKIDFREEMMEVIDTEHSGTYEVSFDDIQKEFDNVYHVMNCRNFSSKLDYGKIYRDFTENYGSLNVVNRLFDEAKKVITQNNTDINYYLRGYNFCFTYKIFPFVKMRYNILKQFLSETSDSNIHPTIIKAKELFSLWQRLMLIITKAIYKKQTSFDYPLVYFDQIVKKEKEILPDILRMK